MRDTITGLVTVVSNQPTADPLYGKKVAVPPAGRQVSARGVLRVQLGLLSSARSPQLWTPTVVLPFLCLCRQTSPGPSWPAGTAEEKTDDTRHENIDL